MLTSSLPMKVRDIMAKPPLTVTEGTTLEDVPRFILDQRIGGVPVVDENGGLTGIITESSFTAKDEDVPFSTFSAPQLLGEWIGEEGVSQIYEIARKRTAASRGTDAQARYKSHSRSHRRRARGHGRPPRSTAHVVQTLALPPRPFPVEPVPQPVTHKIQSQKRKAQIKQGQNKMIGCEAI